MKRKSSSCAVGGSRLQSQSGGPAPDLRPLLCVSLCAAPTEPLLCKFADGGQKKRQSQSKYPQNGRPWHRDGEVRRLFDFNNWSKREIIYIYFSCKCYSVELQNQVIAAWCDGKRRNVGMTDCIVHIHQSHIKIQIRTQSSVTFLCVWWKSLPDTFEFGRFEPSARSRRRSLYFPHSYNSSSGQWVWRSAHITHTLLPSG